MLSLAETVNNMLGRVLEIPFSDKGKTILNFENRVYHFIQKSKRNSFPLYVLLLSGCGGGNSSSGSSASNSTFVHFIGSVIKGPLQGATVFLDANNNQLRDLNETSVTTDLDGKFEFTSGDLSLPLIVDTSDAIDWSSGTSIGGLTLKASAGSTVITPITTMMVDTGMTSDQVAKVLGLPEDVSYSDFNPYALGVDNSVAVAVENAGHKIISTITTFANILENEGLPSSQALINASDAMVEVIKEASANSDTVDLSTPEGVAGYAGKLVTASGVQISENILSSTNNGIAAVNAEIDKVDYIESKNTQVEGTIEAFVSVN